MSSDPAGLLSLLESCGAELHALFTRLTLRADVAEDLLQELFLKLRNAPGFARATNRRAYAFRTAIHLAFDWRRSQWLNEPLQTEPASAPESALDRMVDAEQLDQVLEAMRNLSKLGRQVITLRYLQQQDYAEIGAQIGKTEHQVRGLCHKALKQLQAMLQPVTHETVNGGALT